MRPSNRRTQSKGSTGVEPSQPCSHAYGPFGEPPRATDPQAANPFRFSTKYRDGESGLYYYGYRYYSTRLGRRPSRDPIGEKGGLHLYSFVFNTPPNGIDRPGLQWNKVNCWAIGTSASFAAHDIMGATITWGVKGTACDCCNDEIGEMRKEDYLDVTGTSGGSIGIGLGGEVKLPFAGRVGIVLKGPQITISNALSLTKECGEPCPELSYTILNVSGDIGGSFFVGSSWGVEVGYSVSYGAKAGIAISCGYFKLFATAYASGGGEATLTTPWVDIHKPFLLDEKLASWEPSITW